MKYRGLRWHSLQNRVTFFVLTIFLVSTWSLMIYVSQKLHKDMELVLGEQQFSTVKLVAASINTELQVRLQALNMVAGGIDEAMLKNPPALQHYLKDNILLHPLFNAGVHIVGANGVALADVSSVPNRVGADFSDNSSIRIALAEGKSSVGRPLMGPLLKQAVFPMVAPIFDRNGKVIGAIAGTTSLASANFLDLLGQTYFGKTGGYLLVAPRHQLIVTASDKSRAMHALPVNDSSFPFDRFLHGYEGFDVVDNPQGLEMVVSAKAIPAADWILLATLQSEEAFASVHAMQKNVLLVAALLTLLTGLLTRWMLRRQLAPLTAAAHELLERSDSDRPASLLTVTRRDEVGQLLVAFNRMLSKLGQREALLKKVLDTSSVGIFVVDHDGRIVQANERMDEMFDVANGALFGSDYLDLVSPAERDAARQNMRDLLAAEIAPVDLNRRFVRRNKTEFWGHLTARHFFNTSTEKRGLVGVIDDITERKHQDEAINTLTNRLLRFRSAMDATRDAVYLVDRETLQFIDVNASACSMLGLSREEILAIGPAGVLGQTPQELARTYDAVIADGGVSAPVEVLRTRKTGKQAWVEIQRHAQRSDEGWMIVTVARDITERKQMEEQVHQLAFYDPLTKLPNRRLLNDRLSQAITSSRRSGCYGALIFLDLDNFKSLNDTHGHRAGDLLLIEAARRLTTCVREMDTVARLGGDEFVVVVAEFDLNKAESAGKARLIAEKIRICLAEPYLLSVKGDDKLDRLIEHHCTASIGVVVFNDSEGTQEDFLRLADTAMYHAKEAGRNLIRFSDRVKEENEHSH